MDDEVLVGGCLCGKVSYEVRGPFPRFYHCHCSRCRRATGSAHASNLFAEPEQFRWTRGEELLKRYDVPSAASFANTFCTNCGAPMPHLTRSGAAIVIPAGSLNSEPLIGPQAHIFFESRSGWDCSNSDLPHYSELPTE